MPRIGDLVGWKAAPVAAEADDAGGEGQTRARRRRLRVADDGVADTPWPIGRAGRHERADGVRAAAAPRLNGAHDDRRGGASCTSPRCRRRRAARRRARARPRVGVAAGGVGEGGGGRRLRRAAAQAARGRRRSASAASAEAVRLCLAARAGRRGGGRQATRAVVRSPRWTALYLLRPRWAARGGDARAAARRGRRRQAGDGATRGCAARWAPTTCTCRRCGCCSRRARRGRAPTTSGTTPLMLACRNGHVEAARLLLEKGAAVDAKTRTACRTLMMACTKGHVET